ncbi:unnamed protein product [Sphenostylis stenocarpa]|uniref:Serine/arginine-rich splicing factor 4 n=1 Tax=Sphenostylis stenocarpa TaxID=92480 RepID=A0AA86TGQ4_9FABA|nr:unnamed protein product [Sphenostylis stenocarpa]
MSLYVGNLSENSRRDELERVFRRFGQCNFQLKRDGYGFVVFDFPPNAEKALRALKGRNICGEQLTLTWSNKQPNTQFSRRVGRRNANELQHVTERIGYARRKMGLGGWSNQKMERGNSVGVPHEEREYLRDDFKGYVGEEKDYGEDFPNQGGGVIPNIEENDRWGEPVHDPSVDNGNGNVIEFDRYEPYQGHDKKHDNEDYHVGYSDGSPVSNSQENMGRAHIGEITTNRPNGPKFHQTCFRCGDPGHKIRNCPKEYSSHWRHNRLSVRQNSRTFNDNEHENKFGYASRAKLQLNGDVLPMRQERVGRRMSVTRECEGKEYGRKKRSRDEIKLPKRYKAKICKRSVSSSLPSDSSASRSLSNSQSSESLRKSSSHSRSRPLSSRSHSPSSKLKSSSKSQYCKGKSLNSRSVSLNLPLSSSPDKIQLNSKNSSINGTAVETVDNFDAQEQQLGDSKIELENLQSKDTVKGKAAGFVEKSQLLQEDTPKNHTLLKSSDRVTNLNGPPVENLSTLTVKDTEVLRRSVSQILDDAPEINVNIHPDLSTIVSMEEMHMVLSNCDLKLPREDENNSTIDAFFGCARLWPWHLVYYRRLKKGPISTENYARRIIQNQQFGIIDKYIRSSSGWGEFSLKKS